MIFRDSLTKNALHNMCIVITNFANGKYILRTIIDKRRIHDPNDIWKYVADNHVYDSNGIMYRDVLILSNRDKLNKHNIWEISNYCKDLICNKIPRVYPKHYQNIKIHQ
jgi:hypothetical protein